MNTATFSNMKNKIDINDFLTLLNWTKTFIVFEGGEFKYDNLYYQADTYRLSNTPLDTKIHYIDDFLIDVYHIYNKMILTEKQVDEVLKSINIPFISSDLMKEEISKFKNIFLDLMENCKFEDAEIRGIQKGLLSEQIKDYIADENYEKAAELRDIINEC